MTFASTQSSAAPLKSNGRGLLTVFNMSQTLRDAIVTVLNCSFAIVMKHSAFLLMIMATMAQVTASGADINLKWKVGDSTGEGDNRYNHLTLVNNSARHLEAPWSVYYSSQAWGQLNPVTPGYTTERILGTLFRLTASENAIAPGDSVNIVLSGPYIHQCSFFPENPYLITAADSVMRVDFDYREASHRELATTVSGYPDGRYFYELNSLIGNAPESGVYDIIPAMKEVTADTVGAPCVIDGAVSIEAPDTFATEARLLTDALIRQGLDVTARGDAGVTVNLVADKSVREPEGYTIDVMPGSIAIGASTPEGIWRGCTSLLSVVSGRRMPLPLPAAHISDAPSLGYRGLHFDVARNFSSKEDVMKLIDYMALYKLNKLHFHLVDDEGWRLAIDGLDELTDIGSRRLHGDETRALPPLYGSGADGSTTGNGYFTRRDFTDILRYAAERHVEVIPEIDVPGHSRAAIVAMNARYLKYRDTDPAKATEYLLADPDDRSVYNSAQDYRDNVMCIAMPSAVRFCKKVFDELIAMYSEAGLKLNVIHVGGDEVPTGAWEQSPIAQRYMKEHNLASARELRDHFLLQIHDYLKPRGVTVAGWQEILTDADGRTPNPRLPGHEMMGYMWSTEAHNNMDQTAYALVNAGFPVVMCNVGNLYLDLAYNKAVDEAGLTWGGWVDELSTFAMLPYDIYAAPRRVERPSDWDTDPSAGKVALDTAGRPNIRGIQGQLWAETYRSFDMVEERMLPKMLGLAERAWNPEPAWATGGYDDFRDAASRYTARIGDRETARLARLGARFHVPAPGLTLDADGRLLANSAYRDASIHYTLDGTEPTVQSPRWTAPVALPDPTTEIRAIAVINGRPSHIAELFLPLAK